MPVIMDAGQIITRCVVDIATGKCTCLFIDQVINSIHSAIDLEWAPHNVYSKNVWMAKNLFWNLLGVSTWSTILPHVINILQVSDLYPVVNCLPTINFECRQPSEQHWNQIYRIREMSFSTGREAPENWGDQVLFLRSKGGIKRFFQIKKGDHIYF